MWKYRYRREVIADALWESRCNALGDEGWILLGPPLLREGRWLCFFRRTITNKEQVRRLFALHPQPEEVAP